MNTSDAFANTYQSTELNKCVPSSLLPSIVVGEHYLKERGTLNEGLSCLRNYYRWFGPPSPHLLHSWQKMPGKALDWNIGAQKCVSGEIIITITIISCLGIEMNEALIGMKLRGRSSLVVDSVLKIINPLLYLSKRTRTAYDFVSKAKIHA